MAIAEVKMRSRRGDSNSRPAVYETAALPLSYVGGGGEFTNQSNPGPAATRVAGLSVDRSGGRFHDVRPLV